MKATSANAIFISNVYTQDALDTDWTKYQVVMNNAATPITLRANHCSSTNLAMLDNKTNIVQGSTLYFSTDNGTTITSGPVGAVSTGNLLANTSSSTCLNYDFASVTSWWSIALAYGQPTKMNNDGTLLWLYNPTTSSLVEFSMSTPGDISTIAATGKTIGSFGSVGFDFSPNGKYIYKWDPVTAYTLNRLTLGTPWDISTVIPHLTQTKTFSSSNPNTTNVRNLRISDDGTKIIVTNVSAGSMFGYALTAPWDIESAGTTYVYNVSIFGGASSGVDVSSDGKVWCSTTYVGAWQIAINIGVAATAWDVRTIGTSITITTDSNSTYNPYLSSNLYPPQPIISGNGKYLFLKGASDGANSQSGRLAKVVLPFDVGLSTNVNISGLGLGATPTNAWLKEPTVGIITANISGRISNSISQLHMVNSTTANANVGSTFTGLLAVGDTVLLNKTTPVTLTGVTETSNSLSSQDAGSSVDYILSTGGKNFSTGVVPQKSGLRFSNDGRYMYVLGAVTGLSVAIHQYVLTEPWDVTTAVKRNYLKCYTANFTVGITAYNQAVGGFEINPDGSSLFVSYLATAGQFVVRQFNMTVKHDLETCTYVTDLINSGGLSSTARASYIRFNNSGTQLFSVGNYSATYYLSIGSTPTPYSLVGATSPALASTPGYYGGMDRAISADGLTAYLLNDNYGSVSASYVRSFAQSPADYVSVSSFPTASVTDAPNTIGFPDSVVASSTSSVAIELSRNGQWFYIMNTAGTIFQFGVRTKALNNYAITFESQASAPTSIYLPDRTTTQSLTPSYSNGNLNFTSANQVETFRNVQFKLTNNLVGSNVGQVQINLWRS